MAGTLDSIKQRTPLRDLYLNVFGFLMPLRWALYVWLCAVWFLDLAISTNAPRPRSQQHERRGEAA